MKQYEIKEVNDYEGETFSYLVTIEDELASDIKKLFESDNFEGDCEIFESSLTKDDVKLINEYSDNGYMDRVQFAKFNYELDLSSVYYSDFPYKGNGLILEN